MLQKFKKAIQKGPRVTAFRTKQEVSLFWLNSLNYWQRLPRDVSSFWTTQAVGQWLGFARANRLLVGPENFQTFRIWAADYPEWHNKLKQEASCIKAGNVLIFDQRYQFDWSDITWHTDWRWEQTWPPAYYKTYQFYVTQKEKPYDVKFPWELSRLSFLLPLAEMAALEVENPEWIALIFRIVDNWTQENPVAYSVNWYPMECSIRAINLALVTQMLAGHPDLCLEQLAVLLRQLTLHGEFLLKTVEYTDIRGNHYAANLVALLLLGTTLQRIYKPASGWTDFAAKRICQEIILQYYDDGVQFEKSVAYHRLVTELFLTALLAMERDELPIDYDARERLFQACRYTSYYTRPDGLAPNIGDNDSARILGFDICPVRDHRPLLALAAAYFADTDFKARATSPSAAVPWLLGSTGVKQWDKLAPGSEQTSPCRQHFFAAGGMFVAKSGRNYLCADYGEVGMKGQGGHGHNDTFSFELCLAGQPLLVDQGSPVYSGDLHMYDRYRSTAAHNTARVDGLEMARLLGRWRISNEAVPTNVELAANSDMFQICGDHHGYTRLKDPVVHRRCLSFHHDEGKLICIDIFRCAEVHQVDQFLHFATGVELALFDDMAYARLAFGQLVAIRWMPEARIKINKTMVSDNYGQRVDNLRLTVQHQIHGDSKLWLEIAMEETAQV